MLRILLVGLLCVCYWIQDGNTMQGTKMSKTMEAEMKTFHNNPAENSFGSKEYPPHSYIRTRRAANDSFQSLPLETTVTPIPKGCEAPPNISMDNFTQFNEDIFDLLFSGRENFSLGERKEAILLLGDEGTGNFIHRLAGNPNLRSVMVSANDFIIVRNENNTRTENKDFKRILPELVIINKTNTAVHDCPWSSNTRPANHDIAANYFIKKVIDHLNRVKFIFTSTYSSVQPGNTSDFPVLIKHAAGLLKPVDKYKDSIALVVTKVDTDSVHFVSDEVIKDSIANYIEGVKSEYFEKMVKPDLEPERKLELENSIKFLDSLLTKDNTTQKYTKIGISRSPKACGYLHEIDTVNEELQDLEDLYINRITFVDKQNSDFGYSVSESSKNEVENILNQINRNISFEASKIVTYAEDLFSLNLKLSKNVSELNLQLMTIRTTLSNKLQEMGNIDQNSEFIVQMQNIFNMLNITVEEKSFGNITDLVDFFSFLELISKNNLNNAPKLWGEPMKDFLVKLIDPQKWFQYLRENINIEDTFVAIKKNISVEVRRIIKYAEDQLNLNTQKSKNISEFSKQIDEKQILRELTTLNSAQMHLDDLVVRMKSIFNSLNLTIEENKFHELLNLGYYLSFLENIYEKQFSIALQEWENIVLLGEKINICILKIKNGNAKSANQDFIDLADNSTLGEIVENAFEGDVDSMKKVLAFIEEVPAIEQNIIAYSTLLKVIERSNIRNNPLICLLINQLEGVMAIDDFHSLPQEMKTLCIAIKNELISRVEILRGEILRSCVSKIKGGNLESIVGECIELLDYDLLRDIIENSFEKTIDSMKKVIAFVDNVIYFDWYATAYSSLLDIIKENNIRNDPMLFPFLREVKRLMNDSNHDNETEESKIQFTAIRNELETRVENLRKEKLKIIISKIKSGNGESAFQDFIVLEDDDLLKEIIENSFEKTMDSMKKVLVFIDHLFYFNRFAIAFSSLLDIIKENNIQNDPMLFPLLSEVKRSINNSNNNDDAQESNIQFKTVKNELDSRVEILRRDIINRCISKIKSGNVESAAQDFIVLNDNDPLSEIIENSFEETLDSMNNVLAFVDNLTTFNQYAIAYSALLKKSPNSSFGYHGILLPFLSKVKEIMKASNYNDQSVEVKLQFDTIKNELYSRTIMVRSWTVGMCSQDIKAGRPETAANHFLSLMDNDVTDEIMEKAFERNMDGMKKILAFIDNLTTFDQYASAYSALLKTIQRHSIYNSIILFPFLSKVKVIMEDSNYNDETAESKIRFVTVKNELESRNEMLSRDIIDRCISKIKTGHPTVAEFNELEDNDPLNEIIEKSFEKTSTSMTKVLRFISSLPYLEQMVLSYSVLFDVIERNNIRRSPMINLFLKEVRKLMNYDNYDAISEELQDRCNQIKNELLLRVHSSKSCSRFSRINGLC